MADWTDSLLKPRVFWPVLAVLVALIGGYTVWSLLPASNEDWGNARLLATEATSGRVEGQGFSVPLPSGFLWLDKVGDSIVGRKVAEVKAKGGLLLMEDSVAPGADPGYIFIWWAPETLTLYDGALDSNERCVGAVRSNTPPPLTATSAALSSKGPQRTCHWKTINQKHEDKRMTSALVSVGGVTVLVICNYVHPNQTAMDACATVTEGIRANRSKTER
jgi:hypothetical protein